MSVPFSICRAPRRRTRPGRAAGFAGLLAGLLLALPLAAQDAARGAELYARFCATCHGSTGRGDGPTAGIMTIAPSDLTGLARGGRFDPAAVLRRIDGRDPIVAHGSPMPIFGPFFDGSDVMLRTPAGRQVLTSQPIADLLAHLETLQERP